MSTIQNVELFAPGRWNGKDFDTADIDDMVAANEALNLDGRVPVKIGHNEEQPLADGMPAFGWISKLRRVGQKLVADFIDVPRIVYDAIKQGRYKNLSVEILKNVEYQGKKFPYVLDAVALLGADPPAVRGLADLQKLALSRAKFAFSEALTFTRAYPQLPGDHRKVDELQKAIAERDAARARLAELESKEARSQITFAREKATEMLEAGVRSKNITPAQRDNFRRALKIDDDSVVNLDFTALQTITGLSHDAAKKILSSKQAFTRDPKIEIQNDGTEQDAMETLIDAARAEAEKRGIDSFRGMEHALRKSPRLQRVFNEFIFASND